MRVKQSRSRKSTTSNIVSVIKEKMQVLDDFEICEKDNQEMRKKLQDVVTANPDKDPREVLDHYCRPMIHAKMDSWT